MSEKAPSEFVLDVVGSVTSILVARRAKALEEVLSKVTTARLSLWGGSAFHCPPWQKGCMNEKSILDLRDCTNNITVFELGHEHSEICELAGEIR